MLARTEEADALSNDLDHTQPLPKTSDTATPSPACKYCGISYLLHRDFLRLQKTATALQRYAEERPVLVQHLAQLPAIRTECRSLRKELQEGCSQYTAALASAAQTWQEHARKKDAEIARLAHSNSELVQSVASLKQSTSQLTQLNAQLLQANTQLSESNESLQQSKTRLEQSSQSLQSTNQEQASQIQQLQSQIKEHVENEIQAGKERSVLRRQNDDLALSLGNSREETVQLKHSLLEMEKKLRAQSESHAKSDLQIQEAEAAKCVAESRVRELDETVHNLSRRIQELEESRTAGEAKRTAHIKDLESRLAKSESLASALQSEREGMKDAHRSRLKQLQETIQSRHADEVAGWEREKESWARERESWTREKEAWRREKERMERDTSLMVQEASHAASSAFEARIATLTASHSSSVRALEAQTAKSVRDLEARHAQAVRALEETHGQRIREMQTAHASEMQDAKDREANGKTEKMRELERELALVRSKCSGLEHALTTLQHSAEKRSGKDGDAEDAKKVLDLEGELDRMRDVIRMQVEERMQLLSQIESLSTPPAPAPLPPPVVQPATVQPAAGTSSDRSTLGGIQKPTPPPVMQKEKSKEDVMWASRRNNVAGVSGGSGRGRRSSLRP